MASLAIQSRLGWGNPDVSGFRSAHVVTISVAGVKVAVHVDVAPIFSALLIGLDALLRRAQAHLDVDDRADDWGYANRDVRGVTGSRSYHAWGLAVDVNATENVLGKRVTTFPLAATRALAADLGLRWGLDYSGRPDPMHFEFIGGVSDARRICARLAAPPLPLPPLRTFPTTELPELHMGRRIEVTVPVLDSDGRGWIRLDGVQWPDVPFGRLVSVRPRGSHPGRDRAYWPIPEFGEQDDGGKTLLSIEGGTPGGSTVFWLVVA